ncbi:MAG: hypothetical protein JWP97_6684 [Labilithrix sp.]|nr:hypothetical protein [Labilithrix sp.]
MTCPPSLPSFLRTVLAPLLAGLLATAGGGAALGCAPAADDDGQELASDGEIGDGDEDATEDALTTRTITGYAAVTPPERRVLTAGEAALVGAALVAGHRVAVIRTAVFDSQAAKLVVDEDSFATSLVTSAALARSSRAASGADSASSPWSESLAEVSRRGAALEHLAVTPASLGATEPFALTIDMCQSRKAWEKRLFDWAVDLAHQRGEPTRIGIAMTGVWAKAHPTELDQLLAWQRTGKLDITWINHSSTHPLHCLDASCRRAEFLTNASVDMVEEVLGEERVALARGMAPSVLFRFPGLTHDAHRLAQLARLSVMAIDGDGWIAKGQPIAPGAVVLVHGNGNEPEGITGFLKQVGTPARKTALASGATRLVSPLLVVPSPPR